MEILEIGSSGPIVELLQSTLKKIGFYSGFITGVFDDITQNAVKNFQYNFGILVDGIVGNATWDALFPYLNGYTIYTVKAGDTLYSISPKFNSSVNRIIFANPNISSINNISVGQKILVPFNYVVPTNISYSYSILMMNISALKAIYPFIEIGYIGNSVLNNRIPYIKIGKGLKEVFYNAAFHANEWITSPLLMNFVQNYCLSYVNNGTIFGYNARFLYNNVSLYIVPMVNPDGVSLVTGEIGPNSAPYNEAKLISNNYKDIPFPDGWKANISGVDLKICQPHILFELSNFLHLFTYVKIVIKMMNVSFQLFQTHHLSSIHIFH